MNQDKYNVRNIYNLIWDGHGQRTAAVTVPGSKSITNRALLLAILADGKSQLQGVLFSDDSRHFMDCVKKLGFDADIDELNKIIKIEGGNGSIPVKKTDIYVGSAGTAARFLTALLGISKGEYHIDASGQMRKRPMAPLLDTLKSAGVHIEFDEREGYFPFTLKSGGIDTGNFTVNIDASSQFLSALLISAPVIGKDVTIDVLGNHGMAYIDMTMRMMEQFGVKADCKKNELKDGITTRYIIRAGQSYRPVEYTIEPDVSAACYFYAMAAILGISVRVNNVHMTCMQGDIQFVKFLEQMGCNIDDTRDGLVVTGPKEGRIKGITADMHSCSDQAITMAAIAPYAESDVVIKGISHIKFQESDRIRAIASELTRMGIGCETDDDSIRIHPGIPRPAVIRTYDDHRMAMGFSVTGLRADGIVIDDPGCCSKTFEEYFDVLENIVSNIL